MQLSTKRNSWGNLIYVIDDDYSIVGFIDVYLYSPSRAIDQIWAYSSNPNKGAKQVTSVNAGIAWLLDIDILSIPHDIG